MMDAPFALGRSPRSDMLRVILLLQGAVLLVTTVEAAVFGAAFAGAPGTPFLLSAAATVVIFAARARIDAAGPWPRRLLYVVEGSLIASIGVDTAFSLFVTHGAPPLIAALTRFVLPLAVVALLRARDA